MSKNLDNMATEELGQLFPVVITDYDPQWPQFYLPEKQSIPDCAGAENILRIEHIGSTAVPGLSAKPTIDILIELTEAAVCDLVVNNLIRR